MNTKKTIKQSSVHLCSLALLGLGLVACSPGEESATQASTTLSDPASELFLNQVPPGALSVAEGRVQLSPGDEAIIEGQIGGTVEPFLTSYAGFILADSEVMFCNEMSEDDHCATPWDACCEDIEQLKARRLSVQFVDAGGNPIEGDLRSSGRLKELDHVVVVGIVAASSTPQNMIIHAQKLAVLE